jgi:hypothetical protein
LRVQLWRDDPEKMTTQIKWQTLDLRKPLPVARGTPDDCSTKNNLK